MDCCPKCGGKSGHEHVLVVHYTMGGAWGSSPETTGDEWSSPAPKTVRCIDCGARVPFLLAQRAELGEGEGKDGGEGAGEAKR